MRDEKERLIEEIIDHCREITRLDEEYRRLEGRSPVAADDLESTAHAVRRLLDRQNVRKHEAVLPTIAPGPAEQVPSVADKPEVPDAQRQVVEPREEVQPLPPPPPRIEPYQSTPASDPDTGEFPALEEAGAPASGESQPAKEPLGAFGPLPVYQAARSRDVPAAPERPSIQPSPPAGRPPTSLSAGRPPKKPAPVPEKKNWEQAFGTAWLLRIGGLLLLIGAAYGAMKLQAYLEPIHRVLGGFALSAVLTVVGWLVAKKSQLAGRTTTVIGLALAYFISFSSYFIEYTKVFDTFYIPVLLMVCFAGFIVVLAERWRLESLAAFGFLLGIVSALVSAPSSAEFALVALGVLSIAAAALLLRNEWVRLTALALVVTYLSTAALWFLPGFVVEEGVVLAHLGALIFYHLIFTAAFWRWSRPYLARERAAVEAVEHDAAPKIEEKLLPYSHAFAFVNSLGVTALSLLLLKMTNLFWSEVEWLLFGLAALELSRLTIPALRRGELGSFHAVMAFGLVTGGLVAAFDGLAESAVLAAQALALCIAASRARQLAWLRPLSIVPAGLVLKEFNPGGITTLTDYVGAVLPGVLLLASALPWECVFTRRPQPFGTPGLRVFEWLSATARSFIAAAMIAVAGFSFFPSEVVGAAAVGVLGVVLLAGVVVLAAETWLFAAAMMLGVSALASLALRGASQDIMLLLPVCYLVAVYFWEEMAKRFRSRWHRVFQWVVFLPLGALMALAVFDQTAPAGDWRWAILVVAASLSYGLFLVVPKLGRFPALVRLPGESEESVEALPELLIRYGRLSTMVALGLGVASVFTVLVLDAPTTLVPAMSMAAVALAIWVVNKRTGSDVTLIREIFFGLLGLSVYTFSLFIYTKMSMPGMLAAMAGGGAFFFVSFWRRMPASIILGFVQLTGTGLVAVLLPIQYPPDTVFEVLCGLTIALILLGASVSSLVVRRAVIPSRIPGGLQDAMRGASPAWTVMGAILALTMLASDVLLSGTFVTVAWGIFGILLLITGFVFLDRVQRFTAIAVFGAAIVRVIFFDLAHSDDLTKVVAFCGLGLLLIVSGIGYGLLSRRLLKEQPAFAANLSQGFGSQEATAGEGEIRNSEGEISSDKD